MPSTLYATVSLFAPLHTLLRRLAALPVTIGLRPASASARNASRSAAPGFNAARSGNSASLRANRPLRVLRVMDARGPGAHNGRMVISGRMADVCAELDRLAALEAVPQPARR